MHGTGEGGRGMGEGEVQIIQPLQRGKLVFV